MGPGGINIGTINLAFSCLFRQCVLLAVEVSVCFSVVVVVVFCNCMRVGVNGVKQSESAGWWRWRWDGRGGEDTVHSGGWRGWEERQGQRILSLHASRSAEHSAAYGMQSATRLQGIILIISLYLFYFIIWFCLVRFIPIDHHENCCVAIFLCFLFRRFEIYLFMYFIWLIYIQVLIWGTLVENLVEILKSFFFWFFYSGLCYLDDRKQIDLTCLLSGFAHFTFFWAIITSSTSLVFCRHFLFVFILTGLHLPPRLCACPLQWFQRRILKFKKGLACV